MPYGFKPDGVTVIFHKDTKCWLTLMFHFIDAFECPIDFPLNSDVLWDNFPVGWKINRINLIRNVHCIPRGVASPLLESFAPDEGIGAIHGKFLQILFWGAIAVLLRWNLSIFLHVLFLALVIDSRIQSDNPFTSLALRDTVTCLGFWDCHVAQPKSVVSTTLYSN